MLVTPLGAFPKAPPIVLGAAEAVSSEVLRGGANEARAIELLAALIVRLIGKASGASSGEDAS